MPSKYNIGEGITNFFRREQRPSVQLLNPHRLPTGEFEFELALTAIEPSEVKAEFSTDLKTWLPCENTQKEPGLFQNAQTRGLKSAWHRVRARQLTSNCIGFIQFDLQPGDNLVGFPFHRASMEVQSLFSSLPSGSKLTRFVAQDQRLDENLFQSGRWQKPEAVMMPGEGVILHNPTDETITRSITGELATAAQRALQKAHYLLASLDPRAGGLLQTHRFPIADGDQVSVYDREQKSLAPHVYKGGAWSPKEPILHAGEAFWVAKNAPGLWMQDSAALGR